MSKYDHSTQDQPLFLVISMYPYNDTTAAAAGLHHARCWRGRRVVEGIAFSPNTYVYIK